MKRLVHPAVALLARNLEAITYAKDASEESIELAEYYLKGVDSVHSGMMAMHLDELAVWDKVSKRTPEEDQEIMNQLNIDAWSIYAMTEVNQLLDKANVKPIDCILTGDVALYLHGLVPEQPTVVNVFVKKHILERLNKVVYTGGRKPLIDFEATATDVILDTEPYSGFRLITIDQILKVLKAASAADQAKYANVINEIEKRINDRTKSGDLPCVKAAEQKAAKPKHKPNRHAYDGDYRQNNPHWENRKDHRPAQKHRHKKDWRK